MLKNRLVHRSLRLSTAEALGSLSLKQSNDLREQQFYHIRYDAIAKFSLISPLLEVLQRLEALVCQQDVVRFAVGDGHRARIEAINTCCEPLQAL